MATTKKKVTKRAPGKKLALSRSGSVSNGYVEVSGHDMYVGDVARALGIGPKKLLKMIDNAPLGYIEAVFTGKIVEVK